MSNAGYKRIALRNGSEQKKFSIHRLVALAFLNHDVDRPYVNHIDGDKLNNHYSNLEWVNMMENNCHRFFNKNRSSKYVGVSYINSKKKYTSTICVNGVSITIGTFKTEEEAYQARVDYEKANGIVNKYL